MPKKSPHAQMFAVSPTKKVTRGEARKRMLANTLRRRAAVKVIVARTAKSRAELDALMEGADMRPFAKLAVMVETGPKRAVVGSWRTTGVEIAEPQLAVELAPEPKYRPAFEGTKRVAPNKTKCCHCRLLAHPDTGCEEMAEWLRTTTTVLRDPAPSPSS